ncbi:MULTISPECIES: hypothetical protein [Klebsiella]|mgnify:CR=1 FL=1|uniref:hypothetical protein n=1 Tax=Klebsiella TaxID=570 RepID=UPI0007CC98E6|nr:MULTISPECIES: hypothetical protein [Klebsiella]EGT0046065.1 hypothetical protein [Klebsiella oxytoca]EJM1003155.1 hypothetical protein [Klebsiella oxytoca]EKQ7239653.1 hypothetical protein [Klebsiella oxytoca]ELR0729528.1 hypothetical protein [Klebsiella oxytoca]MBZ7339450.1 hypothetical protein [Klebsiella grimontii]
MIALSGMSPINLDTEITTDGVTTEYVLPLTYFTDGAILDIAVSLVTSTTQHCSYRLTLHKHNNIGAKVTITSEYTYNSLSVAFSATYTQLTLTLSSAVVGVLKISPIHLNV